MANRWIEFVKNYAKVNNISYTCAMCEIKTKNLYKPLKKEAIKEEPKPVEKTITIKTKKPKTDKKQNKIKYYDELQKILKNVNNIFRNRNFSEAKDYVNENEFLRKHNLLNGPVRTRQGLEKLNKKIIEELNLPENKKYFELLQKKQADGDLNLQYKTLKRLKEEEDKILNKDPLLKQLYLNYFEKENKVSRDEKYKEIMDEIKKNVVNTLIQKKIMIVKN